MQWHAPLIAFVALFVVMAILAVAS